MQFLCSADCWWVFYFWYVLSVLGACVLRGSWSLFCHIVVVVVILGYSHADRLRNMSVVLDRWRCNDDVVFLPVVGMVC
eukprot:scaffold134260_cov64-Attheya_sp.AAC.1